MTADNQFSNELKSSDTALPFLDSDQHEPAKALVHRSHADRPWTCYWPPQPGDDLYRWLQAEFPAVLSWRWDPDFPFDRPWQRWSQEARQSGKHQPAVVLPVGARESCVTNYKEHRVVENDVSNKAQQIAASYLDRIIRETSARAVVPKTFHYLAPSRMERSEKLYHSRLSFLDGLPRTNVVSQAYDMVNIYDVTGLERHFTLPLSGFQFQSIPVPIVDWDAQSARNVYLPFMEAWLKDYFGSKFVYIYTYNVRPHQPA
jgi:hypothetical protein